MLAPIPALSIEVSAGGNPVVVVAGQRIECRVLSLRAEAGCVPELVMEPLVEELTGDVRALLAVGGDPEALVVDRFLGSIDASALEVAALDSEDERPMQAALTTLRRWAHEGLA